MTLHNDPSDITSISRVHSCFDSLQNKQNKDSISQMVLITGISGSHTIGLTLGNNNTFFFTIWMSHRHGNHGCDCQKHHGSGSHTLVGPGNFPCYFDLLCCTCITICEHNMEYYWLYIRWQGIIYLYITDATSGLWHLVVKKIIMNDKDISVCVGGGGGGGWSSPKFCH